MSDNIIELCNFKQLQIPANVNRSGVVSLNYNIEGSETIEVAGALTLSEICFLHAMLSKWINDKLAEDV